MNIYSLTDRQLFGDVQLVQSRHRKTSRLGKFSDVVCMANATAKHLSINLGDVSEELLPNFLLFLANVQTYTYLNFQSARANEKKILREMLLFFSIQVVLIF